MAELLPKYILDQATKVKLPEIGKCEPFPLSSLPEPAEESEILPMSVIEETVKELSQNTEPFTIESLRLTTHDQVKRGGSGNLTVHPKRQVYQAIVKGKFLHPRFNDKSFTHFDVELDAALGGLAILME